MKPFVFQLISYLCLVFLRVKGHDRHYVFNAERIRWLRHTRRGVLGLRQWRLPSVGASSIDFSCWASKNLQNSSAKQKISVTLSSENISVSGCKSLDVQSKDLQPLTDILLIFNELNSVYSQIFISDSRYYIQIFPIICSLIGFQTFWRHIDFQVPTTIWEYTIFYCGWNCRFDIYSS